MKEKFLPIGTVVLLKGGKKELMIISYAIFPTGELYENGKKISPEGKIYEYGACTYPEGVLVSSNIIGFNHDQIEKICHMGYETDAQKEFSQNINKAIEEIKKQAQSVVNKENQEN